MKRFRTDKPVSPMAGFTIIEVLVVVLMLGIIAAIIAPGWLGYVSRRQIDRARSDLAQIIESAQSDAQQKSSTRVVRFSGGPTLQVNSTTGVTTGRERSVGGEKNETIDLTPNVQEFVFNYKGEAEGAPYIVSVTSDSSETPRCIIVPTLLGGVFQADGTDCDLSLY
ncbi:MAG: type II secretion system protein [Cyanobacteria bacterium P01_F01_bin.13]